MYLDNRRADTHAGNLRANAFGDNGWLVDRRSLDRAAERRALVAGLRATPASIAPKYFYDDAGCALFAEICRLPEYYPTRVEAAIFERHRAAIVTAITTAGRAVLFAGGTVVISLVGLAAMRLEYLYGTAAVTVAGVLIVLIASMTLLPAILGFAGSKIDRLRVPFVRGSSLT